MPARPILKEIQTTTVIDEIIGAQQEDPQIGHMMSQWLHLNENGHRNQRKEDFLRKNLVDERGFWKRCPHEGHWQLRVPASSGSKLSGSTMKHHSPAILESKKPLAPFNDTSFIRD